MYHIFLTIAVIASQDQIVNIKQQFEKQASVIHDSQSYNTEINNLRKKYPLIKNDDLLKQIDSEKKMSASMAVSWNHYYLDSRSLSIKPLNNSYDSDEEYFLTVNKKYKVKQYRKNKSKIEN